MILAMQGGPTPEFFGEVAVMVVVGALIAYACHRIGLLPIVTLVVLLQFGSMPHEQAMANMDRFAREVMPELRTHASAVYEAGKA